MIGLPHEHDKNRPIVITEDIIRPDLSNRALNIAAYAGRGTRRLCYGKTGAWPVVAKARLTGDAKLCNRREPVVASAIFIFSTSAVDTAGYPTGCFILHVGASLAGIGLVSVHAIAQLDGPPLLMLGGLAALVLTGMIGRIYAGPVFATTFGMKEAPFSPPDATTKDQIRAIIAKKTVIFDPA